MFNGLSISSILLLIALGLAVTFGLMNVINMAHGELIMIGAYAHVCDSKSVHFLCSGSVVRSLFYRGIADRV